MLQRLAKVPSRVEDVGDAAAHPGGEVAPGRAEDDDPAAGHVLAAVVADALDDGAGRPELRTREALAGQAAEEGPPAGRAVEDGVADDHVLLGDEGDAGRRADGERRRRRGPCPCSRWRRR